MAKYSKDSLRKSLKEREKHQTSGSGMVNLPEGIKKFPLKKAGLYRFDIIPYEVQLPNPAGIPKEAWHYERTLLVHYGVGIENSARICPRTVRKPCPICEEYDLLRRSGDADKEVLYALKPKVRQIFWIVDTLDRDSGVQLLEASYSNFGKGLDERLSEEGEDGEDYTLFADLEDGMTVVANFKESSFATAKGSSKFLECVKPDLRPRKKPYTEAILEDLPSLDTLLTVLSYDTLKAEFEGAGEPDEDDEPKPKKKPAPEPEDDDDEPVDVKPKKKPRPEPEPEDEEEEDSPPPPKKAKKPVVEEPPFDEDDEEPESKPKAKGKTAPAAGKCPHGYPWGDGNEDHDECMECPLWADCVK